MKNIDSKFVRLTFYEASDGPRLLMFGPTEVDFRAVQCCFHMLCSGIEALSFHALPFVFADKGIQLRMQVSDCFQKRPQEVFQSGIHQIGSNPSSFVWTQTKDDWNNDAEMIEGLISVPGPGHQYFACDLGNETIIEVSVGEYGDEILDL